MNYILQKFRRFCAFFTGFVFFISGILKVLDPVGSGLVMGEYLEFLHLGFLGFASKILGTAFALAETIIGAALITGVWRKSTGIAAMTLQAFFTILTLTLVIFNPQMDCGCFGEAIHLTHMETFIKNVILCILLAAAFIPMKELGEPKKRKYAAFGVVVISVIAFCVYSLLYIPLVDFTEFRPYPFRQEVPSRQRRKTGMRLYSYMKKTEKSRHSTSSIFPIRHGHMSAPRQGLKRNTETTASPFHSTMPMENTWTILPLTAM